MVEDVVDGCLQLRVGRVLALEAIGEGLQVRRRQLRGAGHARDPVGDALVGVLDVLVDVALDPVAGLGDLRGGAVHGLGRRHGEGGGREDTSG
ncbi:hypothetical protein D3C86_1493970 [compost metagenome]